MSILYTNPDKYMKEVIENISQQKEELILEQLNELVSRNLLVIEQTEPVLVQDQYNTKITLQQKVRLVLKDQDYIEKLEKENKDLKDQFERLKQVVDMISGIQSTTRG